MNKIDSNEKLISKRRKFNKVCGTRKSFSPGRHEIYENSLLPFMQILWWQGRERNLHFLNVRLIDSTFQRFTLWASYSNFVHACEHLLTILCLRLEKPKFTLGLRENFPPTSNEYCQRHVYAMRRNEKLLLEYVCKLIDHRRCSARSIKNNHQSYPQKKEKWKVFLARVNRDGDVCMCELSV